MLIFNCFITRNCIWLVCVFSFFLFKFCICWWYFIVKVCCNILFLSFAVVIFNNFLLLNLFINYFVSQETRIYFLEKFLANSFPKETKKNLFRLAWNYSNSLWRNSLISGLHFSSSFILVSFAFNIYLFLLARNLF